MTLPADASAMRPPNSSASPVIAEDGHRYQAAHHRVQRLHAAAHLRLRVRLQRRQVNDRPPGVADADGQHEEQREHVPARPREPDHARAEQREEADQQQALPLEIAQRRRGRRAEQRPQPEERDEQPDAVRLYLQEVLRQRQQVLEGLAEHGDDEARQDQGADRGRLPHVAEALQRRAAAVPPARGPRALRRREEHQAHPHDVHPDDEHVRPLRAPPCEQHARPPAAAAPGWRSATSCAGPSRSADAGRPPARR